MSLNKEIYKKVKDTFLLYLESEKLKKTSERFAILKAIYSLDDHFDVESLHMKMRQKKHLVSRATIYNTLDLLLECNLVIKHQFARHVAQYERSFGYRQHDHIICSNCNKVVEFCDPRIQNIQNTVEKIFQFDVKHHSLILYALCNKRECESKK